MDGVDTPNEPSESPILQEWSEKIRPFLDSNPEASLSLEDNDDVHLNRPWGDGSVLLELSESLVDCLNSVRLFPDFSAVYHLDTGELECIFSFVPEWLPYHNRRFTFEYAGAKYVCEFARASDKLKQLATASRPADPPSATFYRNLSLIAPVLRRAERGEPREHDPDIDSITSFWIRDAPLDQEALVELANHINFYVWYYDRLSPKILIHEPPLVPDAYQPTPRQEFPTMIAGGSVEPALLGYWQASVDAADPARSLLLLYQIIEYGAFYFIDQAIRQEARRVLKEPDALSQPDRTISRLLDALARENREEHERLYRLFRTIVDPDDLWAAIEQNAESFTKPLEFDGGFVLEALLSTPTRDDFERRWDPHLAKALRSIRNALVHGRERREVATILPTTRNHELIRPWVPAAEVAAAQVMIFSD